MEKAVKEGKGREGRKEVLALGRDREREGKEGKESG